MNKYIGYRPPVWAECFIRLMHYYGTKIKYIQMAALVRVWILIMNELIFYDQVGHLPNLINVSTIRVWTQSYNDLLTQ